MRFRLSLEVECVDDMAHLLDSLQLFAHDLCEELEWYDQDEDPEHYDIGGIDDRVEQAIASCAVEIIE